MRHGLSGKSLIWHYVLLYMPTLDIKDPGWCFGTSLRPNSVIIRTESTSYLRRYYHASQVHISLQGLKSLATESWMTHRGLPEKGLVRRSRNPKNDSGFAMHDRISAGNDDFTRIITHFKFAYIHKVKSQFLNNWNLSLFGWPMRNSRLSRAR